MSLFKTNAARVVATAFLLTAHARAAVVLELDAAALPAGEVSETHNAIPGGRWQDANAKALPGENLPRTGSGVDTGDENTSNNEPEPPSGFKRNGKGSRVAPSERPHRHAVAARPIGSEGSNPPKPREVWHCRQDAMASVLRSLNLSPRCNM